MAVAVGIHAAPTIPREGRRHPSAVAVIVEGPAVASVTIAIDDGDILAAIPADASILAIDQPLSVPNEDGRRAIEDVLAWCDVATLPVARRRMRAIHGGLRGEALGAALSALSLPMFECLPDLVLRELEWERASVGRLDLSEYRERWLSVRPPAFRPNRAGRAKPAGLAPARVALARAVRWPPGGTVVDGDWKQIDEAARIDAVACAYAAARHCGLAPGMSVVLDAASHGSLVTPCDANLANRLAIHAGRVGAARSMAIALVQRHTT